MAQWVEACSTDDVDEEDLIRFDHDGRTFAIYQSPDGKFYCTDGLCTHEKVHLSGGLVMDHTVECPKHSSIFNFATGEVETPPACENLGRYPAKVEAGRILIEI